MIVAGDAYEAIHRATVARMPLVSTGVAAKSVGVDRATLVRWWQAQKVKPSSVTAGGHARWDVDDLKNQLQRLYESEGR